MIPASIPSPDQGTWQLGAFELRAYAVCIIVGVLVAVWWGNRRWVARGGQAGTVADIAVWAVPFGLVGARLYHVATDYQLYFGEGRDPVEALYIWRGGLGIWGAIALGAVGAWIACRRRGVRFLAIADALAPAIAVAQAIGRWGNWFNQELYGRPTTLPWGLEIDLEHRRQVPVEYQQFETFHPAFLYEFLWLLGVAVLVVLVDRRFRLGFGRAFALYVMAYTAGRAWIEYLRIDTVNEVFGMRLNVWTSIIVFLAALAFFIRSARRHPGREPIVEDAPVEGEAVDGEAVEGEGDTDEAVGTDTEEEVDEPEDAAEPAEPAEPAEVAEAAEPADAAEPAAAGDAEKPAETPEPAEDDEAESAGDEESRDDDEPATVSRGAAPQPSDDVAATVKKAWTRLRNRPRR